MTSATDYGSEMRLIRHALGLTQAEMGQLLGIGGNSIMRYENGMRQVPEPTIRLARQLVRMKESYGKEETV